MIPFLRSPRDSLRSRSAVRWGWIAAVVLAGVWMGWGVRAEEGEGGKKVEAFTWDGFWKDTKDDFETKSRNGQFSYEDYHDKVDELLVLVGPGEKLPIIPDDRRDNPRKRAGTKMQFLDFYPNVMIGIAYYHTGRMDRAREFLFGPDANPTEANRGLLYRQKIEAEALFLQKTDRDLDAVEKFLGGDAQKNQAAYQQRLKLVTGYIAELLDKDYDTSPWMKRAEDYRRRLRMVNEVYLQQQRNQKKRGGMLPRPKSRTLLGWLVPSGSEAASDADLLLAAADAGSKAFKKSEEKRKKGEDAMKKGEFQEALEYFTDALDFLDAAGGEGEELVPLQKLKDEASAKAGGGASAPAGEALAQADQKIEEAKKLLAGKGLEASVLKKANDLLVDARNIYEAAGAAADKLAGLAAELKEVELQVKELVNAHFKKVEGAPAPSLDEQVRLLREIETVDPTNQKAKALLPKRLAEVEEEVNRLYRLGMNAYSDERLKEAIDIWKRAKDLRKVAPPEHKRLESDLARAEQQYKTLKGGG